MLGARHYHTVFQTTTLQTIDCYNKLNIYNCRYYQEIELIHHLLRFLPAPLPFLAFLYRNKDLMSNPVWE